MLKIVKNYRIIQKKKAKSPKNHANDSANVCGIVFFLSFLLSLQIERSKLIFIYHEGPPDNH
jgi:hypothetical protein